MNGIVLVNKTKVLFLFKEKSKTKGTVLLAILVNKSEALCPCPSHVKKHFCQSSAI